MSVYVIWTFTFEQQAPSFFVGGRADHGAMLYKVRMPIRAVEPDFAIDTEIAAQCRKEAGRVTAQCIIHFVDMAMDLLNITRDDCRRGRT